jgi:magnesium transporter
VNADFIDATPDPGERHMAQESKSSAGNAMPELLYLLHGDPAEFVETLSTMRPVDVAEALNRLGPEASSRVVAALPFDLAVQVLDQPELEHKHRLFEHLDASTGVALIEAMSADQQAELFREIPEKQRPRLLKELDETTRRSLNLLLKYPPHSAAGIMTTEFVSVPASWTVEQTLRHVRDVGRTKETIYAIFVTNPTTQKLMHTVSLQDVMLADRLALMGVVGSHRPPLTVSPQMDREDVARLISKYNLLAVPVVEDGKVIGIVTVDDVIDTLVQELTEDVQKFGGVQALDEPYTEIRFGDMIRKRAGWLTALFLGEMLTATAMGYFEKEIARAVVLALFVPLIISSGGNSGSQATSLIIRALALRELKIADWWRVAVRELPSGLTLGAILGVVGVVRIVLWQQVGWYDYGPHWVLVALTVGSALVGVVTFGSLTGSMLPFVLKRFGFDPASASAPFVATLVDVTGLVIYFTVAALLLRGTLL